MEGEDFFFHGAGTDQLVARHDAILADAVSAVGGLGFDGGIPPRIHVDDGVGSGEIETGATRFERQEEDGDGVVGLEGVDGGLSRLGGHAAIEVGVRNVGFLELGAEEFEQGRELGEDEHAVALVDDLVEEFAEGSEFGRPFGWRGCFDQTRVATGLAEAKQLGEGRETDGVLGRTGRIQIEEGAFAFFLFAAVECGLLGREIAINHLFDLFRQLGRHESFGAAQDVGGGLGTEAIVIPLALFAAGAGGDGFEETGKEEFEEGAQIFERVFEGRAGEQESALGVEGTEGLGVAGATIFDVLGFVGDDTLPAVLGENSAIVGEGGVGGEDEIVVIDVGGGGESRGTVVHERAQVRGKFGGFTAPIFHEGGGGDDERGK